MHLTFGWNWSFFLRSFLRSQLVVKTSLGVLDALQLFHIVVLVGLNVFYLGAACA